MLDLIHRAIMLFEIYMPMQSLPKSLKDAQAMADVSDEETKVDWLEQAIHRIHEGWDFQLQLQKAAILEMKIEEAKAFIEWWLGRDHK